MSAGSGSDTPGAAPRLEITTSRNFVGWLAEARLSVALTTYQTGKVFFLGRGPDGGLSVFERMFNRCLGLCASEPTAADGPRATRAGQTLWMSSLYQLWRFENVLEPGQTTPEGYDQLYVPIKGHTTGDIDIHDIVVQRPAASGGATPDGPPRDRPVLTCTLFNCLATTSETHSLTPLWKPPFVSALAPEDRCHLNGIAAEPGGGDPRYVTCVSRSDVVDGWRDRRESGGVVVDVTTGDVVAEGLSMPHSPRLHADFPGKLWLVNSGTGFLGYVDLATGRFEEVAFLSGYGRGLTIVGPYAIVGLSTCRENRTFSGLPLDKHLADRDAEPRCGLQVIDLRTGASPHWLRFEGIVKELYDVVALPGVVRPMALGFETDEIRRMLRLDTAGSLRLG